MAIEWDIVAQVVRSHEDPKVWVPVVDGADESSFLHAGGIRRVKAYVVATHLPPEAVRWRWCPVDVDCWELFVIWHDEGSDQ